MPTLSVAVGVIRSSTGEYCVSRRSLDAHLGGLWEFPGGKLEVNETPYSALKRELKEELGIDVTIASKLIDIKHHYHEKIVLLHVFLVEEYKGAVLGKEGQEIRWVSTSDLYKLEFPEANKAIKTACRLTEYCLVTPSPVGALENYLAALSKVMANGIRLIQFRAPNFSKENYRLWAKAIIKLCHDNSTKILLNAPVEWACDLGADGLHLNVTELARYKKRPVDKHILLSAACHNEYELELAKSISVDFLFVSPILPTLSHPNSRPIGWERLRELSEKAAIPTFALGGLDKTHLEHAKSCGAFGVAGIRGIWPESI